MVMYLWPACGCQLRPVGHLAPPRVTLSCHRGRVCHWRTGSLRPRRRQCFLYKGMEYHGPWHRYWMLTGSLNLLCSEHFLLFCAPLLDCSHPCRQRGTTRAFQCIVMHRLASRSTKDAKRVSTFMFLQEHWPPMCVGLGFPRLS